METTMIGDTHVELSRCEHCRVTISENEARILLDEYVHSFGTCPFCNDFIRVGAASFRHETKVEGEKPEWSISATVGNCVSISVFGSVEGNKGVQIQRVAHVSCIKDRVPRLLEEREEESQVRTRRRKRRSPEKKRSVKKGAPKKKRTRDTGDPVERFMSKVDKKDECWIWKGATTNGRGSFRWKGKSQYAIRVSYEIDKNHEPPKGVRLSTTCKNVLCVRPEHIYVKEDGPVGEVPLVAVDNSTEGSS